MSVDACLTTPATGAVLTSRPQWPRAGCRSLLNLTISLLLALPTGVSAKADLAEARAQFNAGKYAECLASATEATEGVDYRHVEGWWLLKAKAELATGKYAEALATYEAASKRFPSSAELKLLGYDAYRMND